MQEYIFFRTMFQARIICETILQFDTVSKRLAIGQFHFHIGAVCASPYANTQPQPHSNQAGH